MILDKPHKKNHEKDHVLYEVGTENTDTPTTDQTKTNTANTTTTDQTKTNTATTTTTPVTYNSTSFRDTPEGKKLWDDYVNASSNYNSGSAFTYSNSLNLNSIMAQILAGQNFKYDFNEDAMYQQYKDAYARQAKLASQDVMGQAAAMTGGYGNSYAASVGNQAYQAELGKINDVIPELYKLALDRHNMEQNKLKQKYSVYADDYKREYAQHLNDLSALGDARDEALRQYSVASGEYYDKQGFDRKQIWRNEDIALKMLYGNSKGDGEGFSKATFARTDPDGNYVFYIDGKEYTFAPGVNPYTGTTNKDVANGTFSNGYQPNNIDNEPLTKTGRYAYVNGVKQNVWKTPNGETWVWDGTENRYFNEKEITYAD
jgi:hypothetical protein